MRILLDSLQRHLVAIISLMVAVTALFLSVERSSRSEYQHNIRDASFRVLAELSQLQLLVDNAHYGRVPENPIAGWARVNYMRDLAAVIPEPVPTRLANLYSDWREHIDQLGRHDNPQVKQASLVANKAITESIADSRGAIRDVLISLE
jgi:hypothetical protein